MRNRQSGNEQGVPGDGKYSGRVVENGPLVRVEGGSSKKTWAAESLISFMNLTHEV